MEHYEEWFKAFEKEFKNMDQKGRNEFFQIWKIIAEFEHKSRKFDLRTTWKIYNKRHPIDLN